MENAFEKACMKALEQHRFFKGEFIYRGSREGSIKCAELFGQFFDAYKGALIAVIAEATKELDRLIVHHEPDEVNNAVPESSVGSNDGADLNDFPF